jgi:molecular chaperone GrpE
MTEPADNRKPEEGAAEPPVVEDTSGAGEESTATEEVSVALELAAQVQENWDKYLRAAAELDNVRKRAARDVEHARKFALERFSTELLAVRDSLEAGLNAADQADAAALQEGSEATLKLLAKVMGQFGVEELDPLGEPFDPNFHEAMTMQPSAEMEPGSVLMVVQKGYTLNGRLLRPARVVVAAAPPESQAT